MIVPIYALEKGTNLIINNENCDISEIDVDTLYQGRMKK